MERELKEHIDGGSKNTTKSCKGDMKKKKGLSQKRKRRGKEKRRGKRKRQEEDDEVSIEDGEKVFLKPRTSKIHYLEIVKEMEYIKGMPSAFLLPMMVDWVLACEIKRKKSRNINGTITRQMRECLSKLYCTIGEIQTQRENPESVKLKKQLEEMKKRMEENQEGNKSLWRELEQVKNKVNVSTPSAPKRKDKSAQTPNSSAKENKKDGRKEDGHERGTKNTKRNSQPVVTLLERRRNNLQIRRELSYPLDNRRPNYVEEEALAIVESSGRRKEEYNKRKKRNRTNTVEKSSAKKRSETERITEKKKSTTEVWSKVMERKERKQSVREEVNKKGKPGRIIEKEKTKKRKPFKTSAVVITTNDKNIS